MGGCFSSAHLSGKGIVTVKKGTFIRRNTYPYLFIAPALILLLVFKIYPIFQSVRLSFIHYNLIIPSKSEFVGLENFERLTRDRHVWAALKNTVHYALGSVIPGLVISLILSLLLVEAWVKFKGTIRAVLFLPYIISITIAGLVWSFIYNPDFGMLNYLLSFIGVSPISWLGNPSLAMWSVIVVAIWKNLGYNIIIWTAGITAISSEYRDAAKVDGANYIQELWYVRLPLLKPVFLFLSMLGIINSFQSFDAIYVMTEGGPIRSTEVIVYYLWKMAFGEYDLSYAAAISLLVFGILIILSLLQMWLTREEKE